MRDFRVSVIFLYKCLHWCQIRALSGKNERFFAIWSTSLVMFIQSLEKKWYWRKNWALKIRSIITGLLFSSRASRRLLSKVLYEVFRFRELIDRIIRVAEKLNYLNQKTVPSVGHVTFWDENGGNRFLVRFLYD